MKSPRGSSPTIAAPRTNSVGHKAKGAVLSLRQLLIASFYVDITQCVLLEISTSGSYGDWRGLRVC
jgi:hypothetical protein